MLRSSLMNVDALLGNARDTPSEMKGDFRELLHASAASVRFVLTASAPLCYSIKGRNREK
jgi:hypothetical protein